MKNRDQGSGARGWGRQAGFLVLCAGGWGVALLLTALVASLSGFAKQHAEVNPAENLTIELHVYDYAQVESKEMARAQGEASRVLQPIGIEVAWMNCTVPGMEQQNAQECGSASEALVLRILPRAMAERLARPDGSLGFAQSADDGPPGGVASVFYHRVQGLAVDSACPRGVILGCALAHEVGHLLLGTNSHAPNGIMRAHWTEKEMLSARAGRFGFFPQQAAKMRAEVLGRRKVFNTKETTGEGLGSLEATAN